MNNDDYTALPGVRWSHLSKMTRSPAHYRFAVENPSDDTPALRFGRAVHKAVLEPGSFTDAVAAAPECDRRTKEGKATWGAFCAASDGKDVITPAEFNLCLALQTAIRSDPVAGPLLRGGVAERPVTWTDARTKLTCKCKPDYLVGDTLIDIKTTTDASPGGFGRAVMKYAYHGQMAYYRQGLRAGNPTRDVRVILITAEKGASFPVVAYEVPGFILDLGDDMVQGNLDRLKVCIDSGEWPGYADTLMQLTLPKWATGGDDDALGTGEVDF